MTLPHFGLIVALLWTGLGLAQSGDELRYTASLAMGSEALDLKAKVDVELRIDGVEDGGCLYVPAHDQKLRQMLLLEAIKAASPQDNAGRSELSLDWVDKAGIEHISPALYRISRPLNHSLRLKYELSISGWSDRQDAPKLLNLWHPIYLKDCPSPVDQSFASIWPKAKFSVSLPVPEGWKLAAPGNVIGQTWHYEGTAFSAAFYKAGKQFIYKLGSQTLITLSRSANFEDLIGFAKSAMVKFSTLTGVVPEPTLLMVETDDFEPLRSPGLITLNTPRQPAMRYLQQDLTHWFVWQLANLMGQQWFGLHCKSAEINDHWLMKGLSDILAYSLLSTDPDYFELFARSESGKPYLNLNYRQAQDLFAATLSLMEPHSSLMDGEGISHPPSSDKPFISFIRGTQILRYVQWKLGARAFEALLHEASASCREEGLQPREFAELVDRHHKGLGRLLMSYWASDDWPDVSLAGTEERDGVTFLKVHYDNELLMPVDVWITSKDGVRSVLFVEPLGRDVEVALAEKLSDIQKIEINPGRALFDKDRFNNKTGAPKVAFFPGAARGLEDDAYTVAWLPYVSQLPGEPFTINLFYQTLRYLSSGVTGLVRYQPSTDKTGFNVYYLKPIPEHSLYLVARIAQDDGHVEEGERRISLDISRRPIFALLPQLSTSARIKSKQLLGQKDTRHLTIGGNLSYEGSSDGPCSHNEETESEATAYVPSEDFHYVRSFARLSAGCENRRLGGRFRLFYGSSRATGHFPKTALFRAQNLDEARVRLDRPNLPGSLRIMSFNTEISTPARLPLPESWFVLPRRSQFKVFFDGAELKDPDRRLTASGIGYSLPIGGDIAGKDSVTFFRFSLNAVLHRKIDDKVDSKPGFLFDFGGNL
jgi:hypothetical protein